MCQWPSCSRNIVLAHSPLRECNTFPFHGTQTVLIDHDESHSQQQQLGVTSCRVSTSGWLSRRSILFRCLGHVPSRFCFPNRNLLPLPGLQYRKLLDCCNKTSRPKYNDISLPFSTIMGNNNKTLTNIYNYYTNNKTCTNVKRSRWCVVPSPLRVRLRISRICCVVVWLYK